MDAPMPNDKRLVIVGATGMVGGYALRSELENEQGPVFENSDIRAMVESLHPASVQAKGRT